MKPGAGTEPLAEEVLEEYFECLAKGDWQSVLALEPHETFQVIIYSAAKLAQLWIRLEQRTTT